MATLFTPLFYGKVILILLIHLAASALLESPASVANGEELEFTERHMGTLFRLVIYVNNEKERQTAALAADSAFRKAEYLNSIFSDYDSESELSRLSASAGSGRWIEVSDPLWEVLAKARDISLQTGGAFDITTGPYTLIWREVIRGLRANLPSRDEMELMASAVGYQYMELNAENRSVMLKKEGMRLDLGGIAKGYTADRMMSVLNDFGFYRVLVNAGGDIVIGNPPPGRDAWHIAVIAHDEHGNLNPVQLKVSNRALTTSGDLFQYIMHDGIRYSHIVDPKTGTGVTRQTLATVTGKKGIITDALATALNILPPEQGMKLIQSMEGYEARIEIQQNHTIQVYETCGFRR